MGVIENELRRELKRVRMSKIILSTIAAVGLLGVAVLAPNIIQVLDKLDNKSRKTNNAQRVRNSLSRLIQSGAIRKIHRNNKVYFELTEKGHAKLNKITQYDGSAKHPRKWDKKWRIVSFDIYEKRKKARDRLRYILKSIGYVQLHKSMWVYPYDSEDLVTLIKSDLRMGKNVLYIIADKIESDKSLRKYFNLS